MDLTKLFPPTPIERKRTQLPPLQELLFQLFYANEARKNKLNPNPDDPLHKYNYRGAWKEGYGAGADAHWPSQFKDRDHPNRIIYAKDKRGRGGLFDTIDYVWLSPDMGKPEWEND